MESIPNYMADFKFLKQLDEMHIKEKYVKIVLLDWLENELEEIQGRVSSGSISVNGSSFLRRTGSMSFLPDDNEITYDLLKSRFALNKKIKVYCGYANTTNQYPEYDIIWFLQGLFIITGVNITQDLSGLRCNISFQDKMCLLNGDFGGVFPAATTINALYDAENNRIGEATYFQMIQELVHHIGGEQLSKILITLPDVVTERKFWNDEKSLWIKLSDNANYYTYSETEPTSTIGWEEVKFNSDFGSIFSSFYWNGQKDLVAEAGSSVTSTLEQIANSLGNYEFFYDIYGNFIFQEKHNFLNTIYTEDLDKDNFEQIDYFGDIINRELVYDFTNSNIIAAYSSTPDYKQIKNDFTIWGTKGNKDGAPIRYRLVIDKKPEINNNGHKVVVYNDDGIQKAKVPLLISNIDELQAIGQKGMFYYMETSDKPLIYSVEITYDSQGNITKTPKLESNLSLATLKAKCWQSEIYFQGLEAEVNGTAAPAYFEDLKHEWPRMYDIKKGKFYPNYQDGFYYLDMIDMQTEVAKFSVPNIGRRALVNNSYVNKVHSLFRSKTYDNIILIDNSQSDIDKSNQKMRALQMGYKYLVLPGYYFSGKKTKDADGVTSLQTKVATSGSQKSAFEYIRDLLVQYTNYNETVNITTLPIYYLEPNYNIRLDNEKVAIHGDYTLQSFTVPLDNAGTMSLQATKVLNKL